MLSRLPAAIVRAFLVILLVGLPSALLGSGTFDSTLIIALAAIFAALFTFIEYSAISPSMVEFRDAPPFNRARFAGLFAIVFCLVMIFQDAASPSRITVIFQMTGAAVGEVIDLPYSPVRLMVLMMPEDTDPALLAQLRSAAGLSYLIALLSVIGFIILLRLQRWPRRDDVFNVWVNLPTFDPTAGGDVVKRLQRDGRFNIILGILLPFLVPVALTLLLSLGAPISLQSAHTLIWTVATWAFLPASILMRGVALTRVADMIAMQRMKARDRVGAGPLAGA
ncbi:MAG: hypothetical protein ACK4TM_15440 [Yoonia sp.]